MEENFDYIIVGAGSADFVLANKLSESERNSILLIEAGEGYKLIYSYAFWLFTNCS